MRRIALSVCLLFLLTSPLMASPYDWRAYPNGTNSIHFLISGHWLLLDAEALDPVNLARTVAEIAPSAVLTDVLPLIKGRIAVRLDGLGAVDLRDIANRLVGYSIAHRAWPVASRGQGVGFFDDHLVFSMPSTPDPAQLAAAGVTLLGPAGIPNMWIGLANDDDGIGAAWRLTHLPGIDWAEPDLIRDAITLDQPADPQLEQQWHLESPNDVGDIQAATAWETTTGDPQVLVGVFDTGFDMDHPDLIDNIVGGFDAASGDDNPEAECDEQPDGAGRAQGCPAERPYRESHGTAVAGIIAARSNEINGTGVCPDCSLYPVRFLGSGGFRSVRNAASFNRAAIEGTWVINNSWGPSLTRFFPLANSERQVFDDITHNGRDGKGVVLVFAAGNDFFTPANANPYATHPGVITVSASTRIDDFACYSNYGSVIAIAGPSQGCFRGETGIATTDYVGPNGYSSGDFTTTFGGTSAASPVIAGVAALILSANPDLTAQQVRLVLQRSAIKINADKNPWMAQYGINLEEVFAYDEHGFSLGFGYGRADAGRAVALAIDLPDAVGGLCDDACPRCVNDRCAPNCMDDTDCPAATRCLETDSGLACVIPEPAATDPGQPCTADCEACVQTFDSEFNRVEICTQTCGSDEDCAFGFDCRTVDPEGLPLCVPGNAECGTLWGVERCQGDVQVSAGGVEFCSCDCVPNTPGACPDGFECKPVVCQRRRRAIVCEEAPGRQGNYVPQCLPNANFQRPCTTHDECPGGLFCIDGECGADTDRQGCDICAPCTDRNDCGPGSRCRETPRGKRCFLPCEFGGPDAQCPGDSVCTDLPGPLGDHCANPSFRQFGFCPRVYRCETENRCFIPGDCPDGITCGEDNACEIEPVAPDAAPTPDAAPDAAIPDATPDSATEPDAATDPKMDAGTEVEIARLSGGGGCSQVPSDARFGWLVLGLLLVLRRRR